jgi:hypothetical protein
MAGGRTHWKYRQRQEAPLVDVGVPISRQTPADIGPLVGRLSRR